MSLRTVCRASDQCKGEHSSLVTVHLKQPPPHVSVTAHSQQVMVQEAEAVQVAILAAVVGTVVLLAAVQVATGLEAEELIA